MGLRTATATSARSAWIAALAVVALGCGGSEPDAKGPGRPLPAYAGHATELFDDAIEPRAVGLDLEQTTISKSDARFRERAQVSDVVVRARVSTITGKVEGADATYQVGFKVLDTLAGKHPVGAEFTVRFDKTSPSIGILKSFEGRLVGKTMVLFVRTFVRPDADQEVHIHAVADRKEVLDAVREAVILDELAGGRAK